MIVPRTFLHLQMVVPAWPSPEELPRQGLGAAGRLRQHGLWTQPLSLLQCLGVCTSSVTICLPVVLSQALYSQDAGDKASWGHHGGDLPDLWPGMVRRGL